MNGEWTDGDLRSLLRAGDPLEPDGQASDSMRRLRGRVIAAAHQPPRSATHWTTLPRLACAGTCLAALALAAYVAVTWLPSGGRSQNTTSAVVSPPRVAQSEPTADPSGSSLKSRGLEEPPPARARRASPVGTRATPSSHARPTPARTLPVARQDDRPRQIQFTASGGTRIVWVIDARFVPPRVSQDQEDTKCAGF